MPPEFFTLGDEQTRLLRTQAALFGDAPGNVISLHGYLGSAWESSTHNIAPAPVISVSNTVIPAPSNDTHISQSFTAAVNGSAPATHTSAPTQTVGLAFTA